MGILLILFGAVQLQGFPITWTYMTDCCIFNQNLIISNKRVLRTMVLSQVSISLAESETKCIWGKKLRDTLISDKCICTCMKKWSLAQFPTDYWSLISALIQRTTIKLVFGHVTCLSINEQQIVIDCRVVFLYALCIGYQLLALMDYLRV